MPGRSGGTSDTRAGLVVANFGRRVIVEDPAGERRSCLIKGRRLRPVCGDRVTWQHSPRGDVVTAIDTRVNSLTRPDRRGRADTLAANFDQLLIVIAPEPPPDPFMTDRYFAAAEFIGVDAALVYNKSDLADAGALDWFGEFAALGYPVFEVSAKKGSGLEQLQNACRDRVSILVGLSGVGKSSLLNALVPGLDLATAEISAATGEGRHTTSASWLHHLPKGGSIIDSPGVRDFAPPVPMRDVARGFREIQAVVSSCKFNDCLHRDEPDCAVKDSVLAKQISERRYASYRRLLNLMRQLPDAPT